MLLEHEDVLFAYLFGSAAKGRFRPGSDLDIAVFREDGGHDEPEGRADRARRGLALEAELERVLGRPVEVVSLNDAPPGLAQNVLKTGTMITARDQAARRRYYVEHARRYYDMEGARRIFDRYRSRRIEKCTFGGGEGHGS